MTREDVKVEFAGLTHDHLMISKQHQHQDVVLQNNTNFNKQMPQHQPHQQQQQSQQQNGKRTKDHNEEIGSTHTTQSTIAILRRHPMYDSLVLVKRFRSCLNGFTLEFPTSNLDNDSTSGECGGDDRQAQKEDQQQKSHSSDCCKTKLVSLYLDGDDPIYQSQEKNNQRMANGVTTREGEIVYVPMNGLLDRLDNYDKQGISIDSRVYAFAMGLKTAEKFLTSSSMKEIQETPPL